MSDANPTRPTGPTGPAGSAGSAGPTEPADPVDLAALFGVEHPAGTLAERMGIEFLEATPQRVVATMPVEGNTQPYGLLHGGASVVLAETLGSVGAALHAGPEAQALGIEVGATHHRAAASGVVTGVATPAHLGRTLATYEIVISDDQGRRVCTARLTCMIRRP